MNLIKKFVPRFPMAVYVVILCAFLKAVAYWVLTPYLPIYFDNAMGLEAKNSGYLIGIGSLSGTIMSVFCGYLIDRYNKRKIYIMSIIAMAVSYVCFGLTSNVLLVLVFLVIINVSSSSLSIVSNTWFSVLLTEEESTKAFSIKYILENIGAMVGPILGTLLVKNSLYAPFLVAAGSLVLTMIFFGLCPKTLFRDSISEKENHKEGIYQTMTLLISDKRLLYFTLGGVFSMMVYGALVTFMSLFFSVTLSHEAAYQQVAYISALNAIIVLSVQYFVSSLVKERTILKWIRSAIIAMALGLLFLMFNTNLIFLTLSTVLLSFGEVAIVPAEYLFILKITPESKRGLYFGAQNLIYLGLSLTPIICGYLLSEFTAQWMFVFLIASLGVSLYFYSRGYARSCISDNEV